MYRAEKRVQVALALLIAERAAGVVDTAVHPRVVLRHRSELGNQIHRHRLSCEAGAWRSTRDALRTAGMRSRAMHRWDLRPFAAMNTRYGSDRDAASV